MAPAAGGDAADADVEILVHVAGHSGAADDARYRQLARAYLAFAPGDGCGGSGDGDDDDDADLSFRGALDNRASPPWRAPASLVADSYPLPDAAVCSATPSRLLERYLGAPRGDRDDVEADDVPSSVPVPAPGPQTHRVVPATPLAPLPTAVAALGDADPDPDPAPTPTPTPRPWPT